MLKKIIGFSIGMVIVAAQAQQPPAADQRLTQPTIAALEAVLSLREAELKALRQDDAAALNAYEARLATAMEWLKAAQGPAPTAKAVEPPK